MKKTKSYEEMLGELETIVQQLERGEIPLDESLALFQKGIEISKLCNQRLDQIEKKITVLLEDKNGNLQEENFEGEIL